MGLGFATISCLVMTLISVIIASTLLGVSFDTLDPTSMGLLFDGNTRNLDCSTVYGATRGAGSRRYFVGLGAGFFQFRFPIPTTQLVFNNGGGADAGIITSRTSEGMTVQMALTVQYSLVPQGASLCGLVRNYGTGEGAWKPFYIQYIASTARTTLSQFGVYDMWQQRGAVAAAVRAAVTAELSTRGANVVGVQLLSLDVPDALQNEIENTTVQFQGIFQAALSQQAQTVAAVTAQLQAETAAQVTLLNANAAATSTLSIATAAAAGLNLTAVAEGKGYAAVANTFGMNTTELLAFVWIDALLNTNAQLVIDSNTPMRTRG